MHCITQEGIQLSGASKFESDAWSIRRESAAAHHVDHVDGIAVTDRGVGVALALDELAVHANDEHRPDEPELLEQSRDRDFVLELGGFAVDRDHSRQG